MARIWCLLIAHDISLIWDGKPFKIEVEHNADIYDLLKAAKREAAPKLDTISLTDVEVWRVSVPLRIDEDDDDNTLIKSRLEHIQLHKDAKRLGVARKLARLTPELGETELLLIQKPQGWSSITLLV